MKTDSAHVWWDAEWQKADGASKWAKAEAEVMDHAATLPEGARVLDLGAGIGRHALALARAGLRVAALDASGQSVRVIGQAAQAATEVAPTAALHVLSGHSFGAAAAAPL